jgi:hypothetical protein
MAADLLTTIRAEIDARLHELRAAFDEYEELRAVIEALSEESPGVSADNGLAAAPAPVVTPKRSGRAARSPRPVPDGDSSLAAPTRLSPSAAWRRTSVPRPPRPRPRSVRTATDRAILAALEHGSHTVAELLVVTALPARDVRDSLRLMRTQRAIVTTDRDGKTAYALPGQEQTRP